MYRVKHIKHWTSSDTPEVDDYFFKSKKNAEKLIEAFKEYYGESVISDSGCNYGFDASKSDYIYWRAVRMEKVEAWDGNIDEMCSLIKRIGDA